MRFVGVLLGCFVFGVIFAVSSAEASASLVPYSFLARSNQEVRFKFFEFPVSESCERYLSDSGSVAFNGYAFLDLKSGAWIDASSHFSPNEVIWVRHADLNHIRATVSGSGRPEDNPFYLIDFAAATKLNLNQTTSEKHFPSFTVSSSPNRQHYLLIDTSIGQLPRLMIREGNPAKAPVILKNIKLPSGFELKNSHSISDSGETLALEITKSGRSGEATLLVQRTGLNEFIANKVLGSPKFLSPDGLFIVTQESHPRKNFTQEVAIHIFSIMPTGPIELQHSGLKTWFEDRFKRWSTANKSVQNFYVSSFFNSEFNKMSPDGKRVAFELAFEVKDNSSVTDQSGLRITNSNLEKFLIGLNLENLKEQPTVLPISLANSHDYLISNQGTILSVQTNEGALAFTRSDSAEIQKLKFDSQIPKSMLGGKPTIGSVNITPNARFVAIGTDQGLLLVDLRPNDKVSQNEQ